MSNKKPSYLLLLFAICRYLSYFCASLHYAMIQVDFLNAPVYIVKLPDKRLKTLYCIWYSRLVRRILSCLIRTPIRKNILQLINFNIPIPADQGCIIVTCHSPWKKLLTHWCVEKKFALLIGGGKWTDRRRVIQRKGAGITELLDIVKYLQLSGRVITNADVFNNLNDCPVKFLGNDHNASLFTERLAILAKVPIITVIPKLSDTRIEFTVGPQFLANDSKSKSTTITAQIISFIESEIESNPSIWTYYVN